ncbi:MAG TPA: GDP-mannose 4,6-dehydratase [Acidimicrobiales bacterium]|nr:GDP-mannose 4,6-dehydratase [Acidimicrobiales bacterium]
MASFLITGGAGFIGSHLAEALLARGDEVSVLDSLSTGRATNLAAIARHPRFRFTQGSVLDELAVDHAVRNCDVVIHLAAAVGVKLIVEQPLYSLTTNIKGAISVLEAAHRYRRKVMVASSSEIYGKNDAEPLKETSDRVLGSPAVARWAYSTSKAVDEILAYAYHRERGLPTIVVRLFNTVGPRQSPAYGMVVPRLVRQALAGEPLTVYGDGSQTRCFCHVADVVGGLVGLLDEPAAVGDVFNLGSSEEISIEHLAETVIARTESSSPIVHVPYDVAYEAGFEDMARRVPDVGRIQRLTGWKAKRRLVDVLDDVIAEARAEMRAYVLSAED